MLRLYHLLLMAALVLATGCALQKKSTTTHDPFGDRANDWITIGNADWRMQSLAIVGRVGEDEEGFLVTPRTYEDFELRLEFKADSLINSGVFVRCAGQDMNPNDCQEINIWDLHPRQEYRTGAIVLRAEPLEIVNTLGKWNTYRIICKGDRTQVYLNDILTADYRDANRTSGYLGLQAAGQGTVAFSNIKIREL